MPLRRTVATQVVAGLQPGGVFTSEVYSPAQLAFGTGGPKGAALLVPLADYCAELDGLELLRASDCERDAIEGAGHTGRASVVQILVRRSWDFAVPARGSAALTPLHHEPRPR